MVSRAIKAKRAANKLMKAMKNLTKRIQIYEGHLMKAMKDLMKASKETEASYKYKSTKASRKFAMKVVSKKACFAVPIVKRVCKAMLVVAEANCEQYGSFNLGGAVEFKLKKKKAIASSSDESSSSVRLWEHDDDDPEDFSDDDDETEVGTGGTL